MVGREDSFEKLLEPYTVSVAVRRSILWYAAAAMLTWVFYFAVTIGYIFLNQSSGAWLVHLSWVFGLIWFGCATIATSTMFHSATTNRPRSQYQRFMRVAKVTFVGSAVLAWPLALAVFAAVASNS